ncbi:disulfide bond formation protein B [Marinomonas piezotolerans]
MKKNKRKPCPYCMKARWMVLYLGCMALIGLLFVHQFLGKGH